MAETSAAFILRVLLYPVALSNERYVKEHVDQLCFEFGVSRQTLIDKRIVQGKANRADLNRHTVLELPMPNLYGRHMINV